MTQPIPGIKAMIRRLDGALALFSFLSFGREDNNIESIFLIDNKGRLIKKVCLKEARPFNENNITEMLNVTQQFIKDSFSYGGNVDLKKLKMNDGGILLEKGKKIYLAVIHSGDVPKGLNTKMASTIKDIETDCYDDTTAWKWDPEKSQSIERMLHSLAK